MERTELAEHIRKLRENHYQETQAEFAARLGLSRVAITRYETSERVPKRSVLKALYSLAAEKNDRTGMLTFSRAIGPRFELTHGGTLKPKPEDLLDLVMRVYANWSGLQGLENKSGEAASFFAGNVEQGLRELIDKLRKRFDR